MREGESPGSHEQGSSERFDAKRFEKTLASFGLTDVHSDQRGNDIRTRGKTTGGLHDVVVLFPTIKSVDSRFMYGNNDRDMRAVPIKLETNTEQFRKLVQQLSSPELKRLSVLSAVRQLDGVIQQTLKSSEADERITSTDEILKKGKSACAGKTLIAGLVLSQVRPDFVIQRIVGASSQTDGQLRHSIGHEWLRVADPIKNEVVLYDPYYKRLSIYNLVRPETNDNDAFASYDVDAIAISQLDRMTGIEGSNRHDLKMVLYPGGDSASLRVATPRALEAQISGEIHALVKLKAGDLECINGAIEVSFDPTKKESSSRSLYPLKRIQKVQPRS